MPLSVAELVVTFEADPVDTVGALTVLLVPYVTCNVSVPELFAPSFAVTVITLSPVDKLMLETVQEAVPVAVPFPPLLLLHATLLIPLELSEALPPRLIVLLVAVYVELDAGLDMVTVGTVVSRVMVAFAVLDTFPAASLYQAYSVLLPSPPLMEYDTVPL